jgi:hypothetical protein
MVAMTTTTIPARPRRRGRKIDAEGEQKFLLIWVLRHRAGAKWEEVEKNLCREFDHAAPGTYKKFYQRLLPHFLKVMRKYWLPTVPENVFLPFALRALKGQSGRPKKIGT